MHPLKQLRKLLSVPESRQGMIVTQTQSSFIIATALGSQSVPRSAQDLTIYRTGDSVILANGVVIGRRLKPSKVYIV